MKNVTKRMQKTNQNFDLTKKYNLINAIKILKKFSSKKFTESLDIAINLNIDAKKSEENIRRSILMPYSTGKVPYIIVFVEDKYKRIAKNSGANLVGTEEIIPIIENQKIKKNSIVISSENQIKIVKKVARILGPKGIMPTKKMGTITNNIETTISNFKSGRICNYKNDKYGIVHASIGKINFNTYKLESNIKFFLHEIKRNKPAQIKGTYIKKITISTTMGIGISIQKTVLESQ